PLRHGSAPVPAGHRAADRPCARQPARPCTRLRARLRPRACSGRCPRRDGRSLMRRALFIAGLVLGLLALAGLGASISLVRSARSTVRACLRRARTVPALSLAFERSTTL